MSRASKPFDLDGRTFRSAKNSDNGEVGADTVFHYHQHGSVVTADYAGGAVVRGHLLGCWRGDGRLEFAYHHLNVAGEVMAGQCLSRPEELPDGRLLLHEEWQWLNGDRSKGSSQVLELEPGSSFDR